MRSPRRAKRARLAMPAMVEVVREVENAREAAADVTDEELSRLPIVMAAFEAHGIDVRRRAAALLVPHLDEAHLAIVEALERLGIGPDRDLDQEIRSVHEQLHAAEV